MTDIPAHWSDIRAPGALPDEEGDRSLATWWKRFDDPILTSLIDKGMEANTSIAAGMAALRQARALRDIAAANLWPSLTGFASAGRNTSRLPSGQDSETSRFQAGLDTNWTWDVFGADRYSIAAADANAWASAAGFGDIQVQVAAEIGLNYIQLRSAQTRLEIARTNLISQQDTLKITKWREQAGLASSIDSEQARAAAEQTSSGLPLLQTSIDQTAHALALLTGAPPGALMTTLTPPDSVPRAPEDLAMRVPAEALRQRADVRAAEYQVAAAYAQLGQARAARLPSFSIGGSIGLSSLTFGALTDSASLVSELLASVTLPIFDAGAGRARVRVQQAILEQAEQAYRATVLGALRDVEDALVALRNDRTRLFSLANATAAASTAASLARQQYASGLVDFQVVLETQRTQLSTEDALTSADADVSTDCIRLYKALGGGWRPESLIAASSLTQLAIAQPSGRSHERVSRDTPL